MDPCIIWRSFLPFREEIVEAQKKDKGMEYIRQKVGKKEATCFSQDEDGVLWFNNRLVVPKNEELRKKIWMRLTCPNTPYTPVATRCTVGYGKSFGGRV